MREVKAPFQEHPELKPRFIGDSTGYWPFKGFRFLEATVVLLPEADRFTTRQIICMTRAILGQTDKEIACKLKPATCTDLVTRDLRSVREALDLGGTRYGRTQILPKAIQHEIMTVETFGPRARFSVSEEQLSIISLKAKGRTDRAIADEYSVSQSRITHILTNAGLNVGIIGSYELLVAGATVTGQLDPITLKPITE